MADMEQMLRGNRPFGMDFIKANSTAISVNTYKMVKSLNELAGGRYDQLFESAKRVFAAIDAELAVPRKDSDIDLVVPLEHTDERLTDQVGSKIANLGSIKRIKGLKIPEGFVATIAAYEKFIAFNKLQDEINRWISCAELNDIEKLERSTAEIRNSIISASLPPELEEAIFKAYDQVEEKTYKGVRLAVRSSALAEDLARTSFAGQYASVLNVSRQNIVQAYKQVLASKYSLSAVVYRLNMGFRDEDIAMCVGFMAMIDPVSSGVAYSRNPEDFRGDEVLINATWGLAQAVVSGIASPDFFLITRSKPHRVVSKVIRPKTTKLSPAYGDGLVSAEVPEDHVEKAAISDEQAFRLEELCSSLEDHFGEPQDIEWSIDHAGSLYILQCRPLTRIESFEQPRETPKRIEQAPDLLLHGGVTASQGMATGPVFVLSHENDLAHFPKGAVMVTKFAYPRWAAVMHKAAAVISEQGGIAGHLATVAREYRVPALFGVPGALSALKPGDLVTVDADVGKVYSGQMGLEPEQFEKPNLMKGSPVYGTLERLVAYVSPLNLTNPDSFEFVPQNCKTVHDITRFIHELSVREMFEFGDRHNLPRRSSKRLVCHVPMQWWIVDLEDGFREEVEGKLVSIDKIASIPMLALWEGITAVPWKGPPVDTRGMLSVMFEATLRPEIGPDSGANFAERNLFVISRHFCNLSSKLGFHFSTAEAYIGDNPEENYASFIFKGGAADVVRRHRRVTFIGEILHRYDFRVEVKEDIISARLEGGAQDYMKQRLKVLGYLMLHTRQMDMIMTNDALVNSYMTRMLHDIDFFVLQNGQEQNN